MGYYAYVRSLLIDRSLNFEPDWLHANPSFTEGRIDSQGHILATEYTVTGHLDNHFSVGPSMLWSPSLLVAHGLVKAAEWLGFNVASDGFSRPYRVAMAASTAFYGFVGLLLAFDLARQYFEETWAFLATLAIWFASSLPVYMYFNPSWSHAHSAFAVSLFLWYWSRTRAERTWPQWAALGALGGLMIDIYYLNAIFLLVVGWEATSIYTRLLHSGDRKHVLSHLREHALFAFMATLALAPTLTTRWVIYGNIFASGYPPFNTWTWTSPKIFAVLFSADHGMLTWTPVLLPALIGLICFSRNDLLFGGSLILAFFCLSVLHRQFYELGRPLVLREPIFRLFHPGVRHRTGGIAGQSCEANQESSQSADADRLEHRSSCCLEFRIDAAMGDTDDPRARSNLMACND